MRGFIIPESEDEGLGDEVDGAYDDDEDEGES